MYGELHRKSSLWRGRLWLKRNVLSETDLVEAGTRRDQSWSGCGERLALFCPVASRVKGYPFEVVLPAGFEIEGAVLSDQIKSLDWRSRRAKEICPAPKSVVADVLAKILVLVGTS